MGLKQAVVTVSAWPPFSHIMRRLAHRGSPIFMLHRVMPNPADSYDPELAISTRTFEKFLRWLTSEYEVVTVSDLLREPGNGNRCAVSFDDGWRDNFDHAYPILKGLGVRCSIYLAVNFIGSTREMWQERLWRASKSSRFREATRHVCRRRLADYREARTFFLRQPSAVAEEWTTAIEKFAGLPRSSTRAFMMWEEVAQMEDLVEFGSHTMNHVFLKNSDRATAESELEESWRVLSQRLRKAPLGVAYPWGAVTQPVSQIARDSGYQYGLTVQRGLFDWNDDRFLVPRVFVSERSLTAGTGELRLNELKLYLAYAAMRRDQLDLSLDLTPESTQSGSAHL